MTGRLMSLPFNALLESSFPCTISSSFPGAAGVRDQDLGKSKRLGVYMPLKNGISNAAVRFCSFHVGKV